MTVILDEKQESRITPAFKHVAGLLKKLFSNGVANAARTEDEIVTGAAAAFEASLSLGIS